MTDPGTLYIFVDIETTGLDHHEDHLLEIGAISTLGDLEPGGTFHGVTRLPGGWLRNDPESWPIDEVVRDMHTVSGLLADVAAQPPSAPDEDDLVDAFLAWAEQARTIRRADRMVIAGSGVAVFDVPWLRARADPYAEWPFSYRTLDLYPVRMLLALAGIHTHLDASSGPTKAHRAIDDVQAHLAEARLLVGTLTRMRLADEWLGAWIDYQDGPDANPPGGEL